MKYRKILLAYNGSQEGKRALHCSCAGSDVTSLPQRTVRYPSSGRVSNRARFSVERTIPAP